MNDDFTITELDTLILALGNRLSKLGTDVYEGEDLEWLVAERQKVRALGDKIHDMGGAYLRG